MFTCSEIILPNDILGMWQMLEANETRCFRKKINNQNVFVRILKHNSHTRFIVEVDKEVPNPDRANDLSAHTDNLALDPESSPDPDVSLEVIKPTTKESTDRPDARKADKDIQLMENGQSESKVKNSKSVEVRPCSGETDDWKSSGVTPEQSRDLLQGSKGIKSRLRHVGVSPLAKLNIRSARKRNKQRPSQGGAKERGSKFKRQCSAKTTEQLKSCDVHEMLNNDLYEVSSIKLNSAGGNMVLKTHSGRREVKMVEPREEQTAKDCSEIESSHQLNMDPFVADHLSCPVESFNGSVGSSGNVVTSVAMANQLMDGFDSDGAGKGHRVVASSQRQKNIRTTKKGVTQLEVLKSESRYMIGDDELAKLTIDYNGCLLCGRLMESSAKLSTHLYFCHKVTYSSHHDVLRIQDLDQRKVALSKLRDMSIEKMILSGKHCPVCFIGILNAANLLSHMSTHANHPNYQLHLSRLKHSVKVAQSYRALSRLCVRKKTAKDKQEQMVKSGQHEEQKPGERLNCRVCGREFVSGAQLRKHLNTLHLLDWVDYIALNTLDKAEIEDKINLIRDRQRTRYDRCVDHRQYTDQVIDCVSCGQTIPCLMYRKHLEAEHKQLDDIDGIINRMDRVLCHSTSEDHAMTKIGCPYCGQSLKHNQVHRHLKLVHREEPDFTDQVHKIELELRHLMSEMRSAERKERVALRMRYTCQYCNSLFTDKSTRSFHQNYSCAKNDKRKQRYNCKFCGRRGTNPVWYKEHLKQHTADGPNYICSVCGNGYINKSGLDAHKAKDHNNVKRYSCTHCAKQFYVSSHYKSHLLKHSGERRFNCSLCSKAFKSATSLRRHTKAVHHQQDSNRLVSTSQQLDQVTAGSDVIIQSSADTGQSIDPMPSAGNPDQNDPSQQVGMTRNGSGSGIGLDPGYAMGEGRQDHMIFVPSAWGHTSNVDPEASQQDNKTADRSGLGVSGWLTSDIQTLMSQPTAISMEYVNNDIPVLTSLDTGEMVTCVDGGTDHDNTQVMLEVYVDEGGNIISNVPDVWQIEQVVDTEGKIDKGQKQVFS